MSSATAEPMLAHSVYFKLNDASAAAKQQLVAACKQRLANASGVVYFAAGTLAEDIAWSVSDRQFDVALHMVFRSKADHDRYQDSPEHVQFMEDNQDNWANIRVFDAYVRP